MERKSSIIINGIKFEADDNNYLYYTAPHWPDHAIIWLQDDRFQTEVINTQLGDHIHVDDAIDDITTWLKANGEHYPVFLMQEQSGDVASWEEWRSDYRSMDIESWHGCEAEEAYQLEWLENAALIEVETETEE